MSNSEARKNFGLAVRHARIHRSPKWSQAQVVQKINHQFFPGTTTFYQKKLSRIECGDCSLRLKKAEVLALQKIFGLEDAVVTPVLMCLEESPAQDEPQEAAAKPPVVSPQIRLSEAGQLSLNMQSPYSELTGYCGEYHSLFVSTDSNEKRLVEGLFSIGKDPSDPNLCRAHMTLYNEKHEEIKWYSGPFFINRHYRTWHCILIGHEKQEVCMLTASHFNATLRPNDNFLRRAKKACRTPPALIPQAFFQERPKTHSGPAHAEYGQHLHLRGRPLRPGRNHESAAPKCQIQDGAVGVSGCTDRHRHHPADGPKADLLHDQRIHDLRRGYHCRGQTPPGPRSIDNPSLYRYCLL